MGMNVPPCKLSSARVGLLCFLLFLPALSWAWGCTGHEVIAQIALDQMSGVMRAKLNRALAMQARDYPSRYCSDADLPSLAYFSTWADDYRKTHPETAAWHYWNIPLGAKNVEASQYCDHGCVVQAIRDQLSIMKDRARTQEERVHALLFLVHFVGDVHQPLHAEDNLDRGGNCVPIGFLGKAPPPRVRDGKPTDDYSPNLHSVWDNDIVEHPGTGKTRSHTSVEGLATRLNQQYRSKMRAWRAQTDLVQWAWESHEIAREFAYGRLRVPIAPVPYSHAIKDCSEGGTSAKYLALHESADRHYVRSVSNAAEGRLAAAGARLAAMLEANWPADWN